MLSFKRTMINIRRPPISQADPVSDSDILRFTTSPTIEAPDTFLRNNEKFAMHVSGLSYLDLKLPISPASAFFGIHAANHPNFEAPHVDWTTPKVKLPPVKDPLSKNDPTQPLTAIWGIPSIPHHWPKPKPIHLPPVHLPPVISDPTKPGGILSPGGPLDPTQPGGISGPTSPLDPTQPGGISGPTSPLDPTKPGGILSPTSPLNPLNPHSPLNPIINNPIISSPLDPLAPIFGPHDGQPKVYTIPSTSIVTETLTVGDIEESNLRKTYDNLINGNEPFKTWVKFVANGIIPTHLKFVPSNLPISHNVINVLYSLNGNIDKLQDPTIPVIETHAHIIVNSALGDSIKNKNGTVFVSTDGTTQTIAGQLHDALKFSDEVWVYFYRRNLYAKVVLAPKPHVPKPLQTENHQPYCTLL